MGHLPTEVAPDIRGRSYLIEAHVQTHEASDGVLIAHGDLNGGYSPYLQSGFLVHDMKIGGEHVIVRPAAPISPGEHKLGVRVRRLMLAAQPPPRAGSTLTEFTLLIDGVSAGRIQSRLDFYNFVSWMGLDIGRESGSPVSQYDAPFGFTGRLIKVVVTMDDDQVPRKSRDCFGLVSTIA